MIDKSLKYALGIFIVLSFFSCSENKHVKLNKVDRFYFLSNYSLDTFFRDKPSFDTIGLKVIAECHYSDERITPEKAFSGRVYKLSNEPAPADGGGNYYLTQDLGIIYSHSTTWPSYSRLHSTNDSIKNRIIYT